MRDTEVKIKGWGANTPADGKWLMEGGSRVKAVKAILGGAVITALSVMVWVAVLFSPSEVRWIISRLFGG